MDMNDTMHWTVGSPYPGTPGTAKCVSWGFSWKHRTTTDLAKVTCNKCRKMANLPVLAEVA